MVIPVVYHASYSQLALPSQHRFPINKYRLLHDWLQHSQHSRYCKIHTPERVQLSIIKQVHDAEYVDGLINGSLDAKQLRRIGFPWSSELIERTLFSIGGTLLAAKLALEHGIATQISGGYHHAHANFGSGFCLFNDLVIAANQLIAEKAVSKVLIFDCDVHQGDGTATLTSNRTDIISSSLHCEKNFPARKAHSHHDLTFAKGTGDSEYLKLIEQVLPLLLSTYQPDLIMFDAGVDVHQGDELGLINLSDAGLLRRERLVLNIAKRADIPIVCVAGGGYCRDTLQLVNRHSKLYIAATDLFCETGE
ncbi:histone deacetylase [Shewanella mangrovi]|uniref:Histone deacetylase n=1 Tax=Shewanella mangrovi TaxID=1515746 RepID=A0A094LS81_9GAMM|nr:histone deacetylase [Shewanella mangrovi]KFZ38053.1 histone deacetylase [Shewanella mangrovi]